MADTDTPQPLIQGIARRLIPLRWPRSQKLIGHLDLDSGELLYQDTQGRIVDRVALPMERRAPQTKS